MKSGPASIPRPRVAAGALLLWALAGCATYTPRPLPQAAAAARDVTTLSVSAAQLPFRSLASHRFDPSDGLDIDEVAMLAVARNPQLQAARDGLGVARAQAFAAGLLPDPSLAITSDHPTNGAAGNTNAFGLNLGFDVGSLLARSSRSAAAGAEVDRVNLDLLWQEWQVVSQARLLFTRLRSQARLLAVLARSRYVLAAAAARSRQALVAGNVTLDTSTSDLAALQGVEKQIDELQRTQLQDAIALDGLLGLAADVRLDLVGDPEPAAPDLHAVRSHLAQRLALRPDLLALQAGYRSQEASYRGAVLAQFPALSVGITRARDTSGLYTLGFGLSLSLPILNANRGNIAIERATRARLYDEYQQRLDAAHGEVEAALANIPLLQAQRTRTDAGVVELGRLARRADAAFGDGNLTAADHTRITVAWTDKQVEALQLREALREQDIALQTLLGPDFPTPDQKSPR
ncbi:MAG: TolC family protein [Burkholderiales bacterium]|nr:TolC family protein [Burkholderiales bacterium]